MALDLFPVLVTTTSTHVIYVGAVDEADALAQIEDNGGADLDQLLGTDTVVSGDFTVRVPVGEWDTRLLADHQRRTRRGPAVAA